MNDVSVFPNLGIHCFYLGEKPYDQPYLGNMSLRM